MWFDELTFGDIKNLDDDCEYDPGRPYALRWLPYNYDIGVKIVTPAHCNVEEDQNGNAGRFAQFTKI